MSKNHIFKKENTFIDELKVCIFHDKKVEVLENGEVRIGEKMVSFDNYNIHYIIGYGANGIVFAAKGKLVEEKVAIKIWIPSQKLLKQNKGLAKAKEEIRKLTLVSSIDSRELLNYGTSGFVNEYPYAVMEFIQNAETLSNKLKRGEMRLYDRYTVLMNICTGLRKAHENNIFHGDLHESNIMVLTDNEVKILDFGTSVISGKDYSTRRDSKLIYETALKTLGKYQIMGLMEVDINIIMDLGPKATRLIVQALSKVTALLDFAKQGLTEAVVEDIATFAVIVPFFNMKTIFIKLFQGRTEDKYQRIFNKSFVEALYKRKSTYFTSYLDYVDESKLNIDILMVYNIWRNEFINQVNKTNNDDYIYFDYNEAKYFNGELYSTNADPRFDEVKAERKQIRSLLDNIK